MIPHFLKAIASPESLNPGRKGKGDSSLIINSILSRTGIELGRHLCQVALPEWGWESPLNFSQKYDFF